MIRPNEKCIFSVYIDKQGYARFETLKVIPDEVMKDILKQYINGNTTKGKKK